MEPVEPRAEPLMMYGSQAEVGGLDWSWVDERLASAGGYWVVTPRAGAGHPHPRPVWGVWHDARLALSIGSPTIRAAVAGAVPVTVHVGSVTDVVIVEGTTAGSAASADLLLAYNAKYDWDYEVETYGPLTLVEPAKVMAWRSAGWAGREGFQETGRWTFGRSDC